MNLLATYTHHTSLRSGDQIFYDSATRLITLTRSDGEEIKIVGQKGYHVGAISPETFKAFATIIGVASHCDITDGEVFHCDIKDAKKVLRVSNFTSRFRFIDPLL